MSKKQVLVFCKKDDIRFGDVYFQKGQFYPAEFIHDLLFFKGEMGNIMMIEEYRFNDHFQEFFTLVLSMNATQTETKTISTSNKIRRA